MKLNIPPFCFDVDTTHPRVQQNLRRLYPQTTFSSTDVPVDYQLELIAGQGLRRFWKPQARFLCEGREPFMPLPAAHSYAMLEWGMNWTVATQEFSQVIVHAGVLAFGDQAIMFPAPPGSGKSTLTLWLTFHQWRLLSDEMALLEPNSLQVTPFVRPICLKNQSITLAKQWFPDAIMSDLTYNTHKGTVAHVSPPEQSWQAATRPATLRAIVFPKYVADSPLTIYKLNQAQAFAELAANAFNMSMLGTLGFESALHLVEQLPVFSVQYHNMDELTEFLMELVND